eukprot:5921479-Amphidinium_carterae.1
MLGLYLPIKANSHDKQKHGMEVQLVLDETIKRRVVILENKGISSLAGGFSPCYPATSQGEHTGSLTLLENRSSGAEMPIVTA